MTTFWQFLAKTIPNFEFSNVNHYPQKLEDTWEKTLGGFQPKLMTKIEDISQKPSKTGFLAKMAIFWHFLAKNIPSFEFFHGYH